MLLKFMSEQEPMQAMLQWLCEQLMEAEVTAKVQAQKSERSENRATYRTDYLVRRFDTRMGTMYLFVPKLLKMATYRFSSPKNHVQKQHYCKLVKKLISMVFRHERTKTSQCAGHRIDLTQPCLVHHAGIK